LKNWTPPSTRNGKRNGYTGGWYDKTAFRIDFTLNGQPDNYEGRQDFGDGEGSLVQHIQNYHEYYAKDENWKNFVLHNKGPKAWEQDKAEREMVLTEFIPYLKQHCNLSAMEQTATAALREGQNISPEQAAYYNAVVAYVQDCRPLLNQGQYDLPEPPKLADFDQSLQDYKAQVQAEIAQEAAAAGMTVEEYAAAGFEAPQQGSFSIYQLRNEDSTRDYRFVDTTACRPLAGLWTRPTIRKYTPRRWLPPRWRTSTAHSMWTIRQISRDTRCPFRMW